MGIDYAKLDRVQFYVVWRTLVCFEQVHERQRARMRTRSEWFLQPAVSLELRPPSGMPELATVPTHLSLPPSIPCRPPSATPSHTDSIPFLLFVACLEFLFWPVTRPPTAKNSLAPLHISVWGSFVSVYDFCFVIFFFLTILSTLIC